MLERAPDNAYIGIRTGAAIRNLDIEGAINHPTIKWMAGMYVLGRAIWRLDSTAKER